MDMSGVVSCFVGFQKLQGLKLSVITQLMLMTRKLHGVGISGAGDDG
jgi:hypothetical protein